MLSVQFICLSIKHSNDLAFRNRTIVFFFFSFFIHDAWFMSEANAHSYNIILITLFISENLSFCINHKKNEKKKRRATERESNKKKCRRTTKYEANNGSWYNFWNGLQKLCVCMRAYTGNIHSCTRLRKSWTKTAPDRNTSGISTFIKIFHKETRKKKLKEKKNRIHVHFVHCTHYHSCTWPNQRTHTTANVKKKIQEYLKTNLRI